jgi:glycosidase
VYAHTGISTDQNADQAWKCVKNHWPTSTDFTGNRSDTKLTKVGTDRYKLVINDIRSYYSDANTNTDCTLGSDERIETMNFVFRSADGSKEGKAEGGEDIFVNVFDVSGGDPVVEAVVDNPTTSRLYPFIATSNTTVNISVSAEVARSTLAFLEIFVNGQQKKMGSFGRSSIQYDLPLDSPGRYEIAAVAKGQTDQGNLVYDTTRTVAVRTPSVVNQSRPPGVEDGINYNSDGAVTLSLNAPNKNFAYVVGDFTDWEIDNDYFMKKDGDHWWTTLSAAEIQGQTEYGFQYLVDGERRVADPFSRKVLTPNDQYISEETYPDLKAYPDSLTENYVSVLEKGRPTFNFDNPDFTPPPQDQMVVYELLLRDFLEDSNFQTLTDTLDYLDRLGVNAIELMPVAEFSGNNSWGYNPLFHFALDKSYGTRRAFKEFVQAAHNRDMAVILDVVYNHIDTPSPLRQLYDSAADSPFLESGSGRGICGAFFEELDQSNPFVQNYIDRANRYWVEEYNVDGFRYDLAKCIADGNGDPVAGWKDVADYVWNNIDGGTEPYTYMILEFFGTNAQEQELANYRDSDAGGMASWQNLSEQYGQASMGYVDDNANIQPGFFGFGNFNDPTYMSYMESHDEQWLMHKNATFGNANAKGTYDVKDLKTALNRQKLVGAFFFTLPGPRMTWQFAELGYGYKPDECLQDDGGAQNCPASAPSRTQKKPVRWEYRDVEQSPNRVRLYKTWQALLRLRNDNPELFAKDPGIGNPEQSIDMKAQTGDKVRWIKLRDETMDALIVGNFDVIQRTAQVDFPSTGTWHNFFQNSSRQVSSTQTLSLQPGEFRIYTSEPVPPPEPGLLSFPSQTSTASVSSSGPQNFGATGVDVTFASGTSGSGTVTVEKFERGPFRPQGISEANVSAYRYTIEAGGNLSLGSETEVRLDVSTLDGVDNPDNVTVYSRPTPNQGSFSELTTSYDESTNELVAETGSFSEFVLASNSEPLPVEMAGFETTFTDERTVELSWKTASETNNAGFQVERRGEGTGDWTNVSFVEGAGTTTAPQTYRLTDTVPFAADSVRYRLTQVDADGTTEVADEVTVAVSPPEQLTLRAPAPNPVRQRATVQFAVPERQDVSLVLFDVLGRRVRTLTQGVKAGRHERQLDVSGLSSGLYVLRLRAGSSVQTQRVTVVK